MSIFDYANPRNWFSRNGSANGTVEVNGRPYAKDNNFDYDEPEERPLTERKIHAGPSGMALPAFLPYFDDQSGETTKMRLAYRTMMSQSYVKGAFLPKVLSVASQPLQIHGAKTKDPDTGRRVISDRNQAIADFNDWNFKVRMNGGMVGLVWNVFSGGLIDGYSICERVWGIEVKGQYCGKHILRELPAKNVDNDAVLMLDSYRNKVGVKALRFNAGEVFDTKDFVIYSHLPMYNLPTGTSDFRAPYSCYDEETEVLTESGWKRFADLVDDDKVATLDSSTGNGRLVYQVPADRKSFPYKGKMFCQKSSRVDLRVTPNHRMWVGYVTSRHFKFVEAQELMSDQRGKMVRYKRDAEWAGEEKEFFELPAVSYTHRLSNQTLRDFGEEVIEIPAKQLPMDDWLRFLGLWLADGCAWREKDGNKQCWVGIAQKEGQVLDEIMKVTARLGFNFRLAKPTSTSSAHQVIISSLQLWTYLDKLGKSYEKHVPRDIKQLSSRQLSILVDWMLKGDGRLTQKRVQYATVSKQLCDDMTELALKTGRAPKVMKEKMIGGSREQDFIWIVALHSRSVDATLVNEHEHDGRSWEEYDGNVHCVTVGSGIIYVRRNGKSCWCGNSFWMLDTCNKLRAMGGEKRALPLVYGEYSDSTKQKALDAALAKIKTSYYLSVPKEVALKCLEIAGKSDEYFSNWAKDCREDIVMGIRGALLQTLGKQPGVEGGNTEVHEGQSNTLEWHLSACLLEILNNREHGLIVDLTDENFAHVDDYPTATFSGIDSKKMADDIKIDLALHQMGKDLSNADLQERYGRKEPLDDKDRLPGAPQKAADAGGGWGASAPSQLSESTIMPAQGVPAAQPFRFSEEWSGYVNAR